MRTNKFRRPEHDKQYCFQPVLQVHVGLWFGWLWDARIFRSLWAAYQTDVFAGIAAASPSIWFPNFLQYMKEQDVRADLFLCSPSLHTVLSLAFKSTVCRKRKSANKLLWKTVLKFVFILSYWQEKCKINIGDVFKFISNKEQ